MPDLPTHATCPHCQTAMRMGLWVYAHWDVLLIATCESCGKTFNLKRGVVFRREE